MDSCSCPRGGDVQKHISCLRGREGGGSEGDFFVSFLFFIFYLVFVLFFIFYFKEELGKKGNIWAGALGSHLAISCCSTHY